LPAPARRQGSNHQGAFMIAANTDALDHMAGAAELIME
jgi:hypothetical protein